MTSSTQSQLKKNNLRLALILASIVVVFFVGFIAKMVFIGR